MTDQFAPDLQRPGQREEVLLSVNPNAGARSAKTRVARLVESLERWGLCVQVMTDLAAVAAEAQRRHAAGSLRALVAAGGDGTVAELVNRCPPVVPLSVFPLGTENLLAKYLRIGPEAEAAAEVIATGVTLRIDAGRADGRLFLLMASCGLDADVIHRLHAQRRGHIRHLSYLKPIVHSARSYQYPPLRVYCDEQPSQSVRWVHVVNLPCYALGLRFAPDADGTDGQLDVCSFRRGGAFAMMRYYGAVLAGNHRKLADCEMGRARRVRIESDEAVPYQLDGDPGGTLPVDIEIIPQRVTLIAPQPPTDVSHAQ